MTSSFEPWEANLPSDMAFFYYIRETKENMRREGGDREKKAWTTAIKCK